MDESRNYLLQRKIIALLVIAFGAFYILYTGVYKFLLETIISSYWWYLSSALLTAVSVVSKALIVFLGLAAFVYAKRRNMEQTAWYSLVLGVILAASLFSSNLFVGVSVGLLFVGIVLSDKITKIAAGLLINLNVLIQVIGYIVRIVDFSKRAEYWWVLRNIEGYGIGLVFVLTGILLLLNKESKTRKARLGDTIQNSDNGMRSVGLTIIYSAVYFLFAFGLYILLNRLFFNEPIIDADLVPKYLFFKVLCIVLIPAGLIPIVIMLSRKYRPKNDNWVLVYDFLVGSLYIFIAGLIAENFYEGYFSYFQFSVIMLVSIVCGLALIIKEIPRSAFVTLAIALLLRRILYLISAVSISIFRPDRFKYIAREMFSITPYNHIFVPASALVLYLALGIVLFVRSKKIDPVSSED